MYFGVFSMESLPRTILVYFRFRNDPFGGSDSRPIPLIFGRVLFGVVGIPKRKTQPSGLRLLLHLNMGGAVIDFVDYLLCPRLSDDRLSRV